MAVGRSVGPARLEQAGCSRRSEMQSSTPEKLHARKARSCTCIAVTAQSGTGTATAWIPCHPWPSPNTFRELHKNVFVNCPFDDDYRPLLRPLLFTIAYLGLKPRIALEELDSGSPRIQKIIGLIRISRYAIHDLSRLQARKIR